MYRMQRNLHSILTTRILLNLREAVRQDRARRALANSDMETTLNVSERYQRETPTALSSVVIGVDTWFRDSSVMYDGERNESMQ